MRILDYQAALALYLAIIAQAHRDAGGLDKCHYSERADARAFLAALQGCHPDAVKITTARRKKRRQATKGKTHEPL